MADATQRTVNTFQKGMHTGLDKSQSPQDSYLDSFNGRVIYNEGGTYAWENAKGTKQVLTIAINHGGIIPPVPVGYPAPQYVIIGQCTVNGQCVVLLTNDYWSEIGVISQPQYGVFSYATIYNDYNDPQGPFPSTAGIYAGQGRLQLKRLYNAKMKGILEDLNTTRIYFWDDYNENRTLNITPPNGAATWTVPYPVYHSAHQINSMPDCFWGLMKYQYDISGSLPSGKYQYAYQYIGESGFVGPWSPLTAHLMCTAQDRSNTDWNQYFMSDAGSATTKGLQLEIKNLDQRFQQIQVAALLWETDVAPTSGVIFAKLNIPQPPPGTPPGLWPSLIVQHTINEGVVVTTEALIQNYFEIKNNKTGTITGDNYLHLANVEFYSKPQIASTAGITCAPITKLMLSDGFGQANLTPNQLPFTNGATIADYTTRNMFTGAGGAYQEKYMIGNPQVGTGPAAQDYTNYKGTQWEHLYKSRMRADTYPFALVLFDRKGQPSFAQHITDYTMPAQWNNVYTDSRLGGITTGAVGNVGDYMITNNTPNSTALVLDNTPQGNNICPVILGMQFSGIDLTDVLFDEYGNLQISGFAIVAMPRYGSVIGQGLLLNTTKFLNSNGTDGNVTTPMQTSYNWLEQPGATPTYGLIGQLVDNVPIEARPNAFTFECPDGFFDPSIFGTTLSADTIIPVGIAAPVNIKGGDFSIVTRGNYRTDHSPDNSQWCAGYQNSGTPVGQYYPHYYNKYYVALPNSLPYVGANGNYPGGSIDSNPVYNSTAFTANNAFLGNPYSINNLYVNARNVPNYQTGNSSFAGSNLNYSEIASEQGYFPADSNYFQYPQQTGKGYTGRAHSQTTLLVSDNPSTGPGQPNTGLTTASLRVKDWTGATSNYCNTIYYLANYTRQIGQYSITQTLLDNRVYNNIGHFIPINSQTLALAKTSTGSYIFNNVEVYYGDTYVDFFAYNRIEPVYYYLEPGTQTTPNCANQPNSYTDFAISMAFCVESKYNHTMRSGLTWPRYGTEPMNSYCNPGIAATNPDGIWYFSDTLEQNEQFDIQADLNAANTANQYNSLQACFGVVNTDFPLREIYAGPKIDGECYDSFRQFLPLNYQDATGLYGEVTDIEYLGGYNSLYALQRYAFARVLFNERTGIAAGGGDLLTAIANGYQGHQYISTKDGCQHLFSSCNTGKGWYWIDAENGKQNRFAGNGVECISDIHDYHDQITAWTRNYWNVIDPAHLLVPAGAPIRYYDNPSYMGGIISVYDYKNDSLYTTFTPTLMSVPGSVSQAGEIVRTNVEPHTVEFNAKLSQYQSRHGFYPPMYMNLKQSFFSPEPIVAGQIAPIIDQHDEGVRGQIYGVNQPSYLRYDTNPQPFEAKVFDNGRVGVDTENGANRISLVNLNTPITPLQSVVLNNPALDYRPVYREGFLTYPMRGLDADTRMRGTYLIQEYQIDNDGSDTIVRITGQETKYRISDER